MSTRNEGLKAGNSKHKTHHSTTIHKHKSINESSQEQTLGNKLGLRQRNYHQFRGKFGTESVRKVQLQGRSRMGPASETAP